MVHKQVDNLLTEDEGSKTDVWCNSALRPRSSVKICKVISEWL
jgi:hypothetical protein